MGREQMYVAYKQDVHAVCPWAAVAVAQTAEAQAARRCR